MQHESITPPPNEGPGGCGKPAGNLDPYSDYVDGEFLGYVDPVLLLLDEIRRGEADPSALGPDYSYDPATQSLIDLRPVPKVLVDIGEVDSKNGDGPADSRG